VESVSQARDRPQHKMLAEGQRGAEIIHRIPGDPMPDADADEQRPRPLEDPGVRSAYGTCEPAHVLATVSTLGHGAATAQ